MLYLYVHAAGEDFDYPSSRSSGDAARLANRYLECALVQYASLRWAAPDAQLVFVSNLPSDGGPTRRGRALLERMLSFGVELVAAEYRHAPHPRVSHFAASRYVFDAIEAVAGTLPPDRMLWFVDVDCVWMDPRRAFAELAGRPGVGALEIGYPPDWDVEDWTRERIGALACGMGGSQPVPPWIGGEVLAGRADELIRLVRVCEQLDSELTRLGEQFSTEEQLLTLAGAVGQVQFASLSSVVGRIWTGRRHGAWTPPQPQALALWHLPSEKGLAFRRAANALLRDRTRRLRRDLTDQTRAARRFNVAGARWTRALRDDAWIAAARMRDAVARLGLRAPG